MRKAHYLETMALAGRALRANGESLALGSVRWNIAGDCTSPFERVIRGRSQIYRLQRRLQRVAPEYLEGLALCGAKLTELRDSPSVFVELHTRCRKCDKCRKARQRLWARRALDETKVSSRTWFGTLTLAPDWQHHALTVARARLLKSGIDYDTLDYGDQFRTLCGAINPELTKFLKRVRKQHGHPFRYLIVAERHKSGAPHYHMLAHEITPEHPLRYATLREKWAWGFSQFKLAREPAQCVYLCKYLSKSLATRVRASERYGKGAGTIQTESAGALWSERLHQLSKQEIGEAVSNRPVPAALGDTCSEGDTSR